MRRIEAVAAQYAELFGTTLVISEEKLEGRTMRVNPPLVLPVFYRADDSGQVSISVYDDDFSIHVMEGVSERLLRKESGCPLKRHVVDMMFSFWDGLIQMADEDLSPYLRTVKRMYEERVTVE